jgi:hypothetical protein
MFGSVVLANKKGHKFSFNAHAFDHASTEVREHYMSNHGATFVKTAAGDFVCTQSVDQVNRMVMEAQRSPSIIGPDFE